MISQGHKLTYVGIYMLKKLDVAPQDGGLVLPLMLPHEAHKCPCRSPEPSDGCRGKEPQLNGNICR